jgi:hypothetical protein
MVRCSNCGNEGHRSDKCPSSCGFCQDENHKKLYCPKIKAKATKAGFYTLILSY